MSKKSAKPRIKLQNSIVKDDAWLREKFLSINQGFFNDEIVGWKVEFHDIPPDPDGNYSDAQTNFKLKRIQLQPWFRCLPRQAMIALLHEMTHAIVRQRGNIGPAHGIAFYVEQNRLYLAGAYDGRI
jgi:hypothetical protein